jgi:hypothetical protein
VRAVARNRSRLKATRKFVMKNAIVLAGTTLSVFVGGATSSIGAGEVRADSMSENAAHHKLSTCSNRTIKGTYGIQMQGTRLVPGGTEMEQVIGVVTRSYDGAGNFTQIDNVKGSVSDIVFDRPGAGTYVVNADCTGRTLFQPAPGVSIEERMVIIDYGHEVRSITVSPQSNMITTVGKRIGWR